MGNIFRVLVDSSVWIDFFKGPSKETLTRLLEEDLVCINELILTELLPILLKEKNNDVAKGLLAIPVIPFDIDWSILREMQLINLKNGVNNVGIPDLIILQQVIEKKLRFLTYDRHFLLMKDLFKFDLVS